VHKVQSITLNLLVPSTHAYLVKTVSKSTWS